MAAQLAGWRATLEVGSTAGAVLRYVFGFHISSGGKKKKLKHTHTHTLREEIQFLT